jgi:hypothetical protein
MKLEGVSDLYFVLAVFVPGFVYNGVLRQFVPLRETTLKEALVLQLLTATAFNYALCSPLIYLLFSRPALLGTTGRAAAWFVIIFVSPILLAILRAVILQHAALGWLSRLLRLKPISPIPTGWDWVFGRTNPCFVLITLTDGTEIAGYFGQNSMASSDPDRKDIYIETLYTVPDDGGPWVMVEGRLGMHVDGHQIAFIEFKE